MYLSLPQTQDWLPHPVPIHLQNQTPSTSTPVSITFASILRPDGQEHAQKKEKQRSLVCLYKGSVIEVVTA